MGFKGRMVVHDRYTFKHLFFTANPNGRDIVVGDIHGFFSILEKGLIEINFDPDKDRLFALGDMGKHVVQDLDAVFHGHSIPNDRMPFNVDNRFYIETGGFLAKDEQEQGGLTLIDIRYPHQPLLSSWRP